MKSGAQLVTLLKFLTASSSASNLTLPNDAGSVIHELWYNECLAESTPFLLLARPRLQRENGPVANVPVASPQSNVSSASLTF
jgi:hypothetical protein